VFLPSAAQIVSRETIPHRTTVKMFHVKQFDCAIRDILNLGPQGAVKSNSKLIRIGLNEGEQF
jgi:hypothetical protein